MDYYLIEIDDTKKLFDLDEILSFQLDHDIQIIWNEDCQYQCWIDKEAYSAALTPMGALVYGIKQFKERL